MQRIIARSLLIQKKFISRCTKVHQYEMVLYNEKPHRSTSLVVRFEDENKLYQADKVKNIKSNSSRTLSSSGSCFIVLLANSGRIITPVIEEQIDNEKPGIKLTDTVKWLAKAPDSEGKDSVQPGGRLGRLDAANEAGFFHRTDRSRLKEIKKKLKDKVDIDPGAPKKT